MAASGFTIRENQIELSKMMYEGIKQNHIAICEAEVGTGKTYAYIVACVVYALYERQKRSKAGILTYLDNEYCSVLVLYQHPVLICKMPLFALMSQSYLIYC
jgi:ATP-dependent DNA helicase DinG